LQGPREERGVVDLEVLALVVEALAPQQAVQNLDAHQDGQPDFGRMGTGTNPGMLLLVIASAHTDDQPPSTEVIDRRDRLPNTAGFRIATLVSSVPTVAREVRPTSVASNVHVSHKGISRSRGTP
jgi:hypothetical protein